MPSRCLLVTLVALLGTAAAAQPRSAAPRIRVWVEPWTVDVSAEPHERPTPSAQAWTLGEVQLAAARGHHAACQLVLVSGTEPVRDITPVVGDFRGTSGLIPREHATLYRARAITVTNLPSWYLRQHGPTSIVRVHDVLEPLGAFSRRSSISLSAEDRAVLWLDVRVPHSAAPGKYEAEVGLELGPTRIRACRVTLDVMPETLSPTSRLPILAGIDLASIESLDPALAPDDWTQGPADAPESMRMRRRISDYHNLLQQHGVHGYVVASPKLNAGTPGASIRATQSAAAMLDTLRRELVERSRASLPPAVPSQLVLPVETSEPCAAMAARRDSTCNLLHSTIDRIRADGWIDSAFMLTPPPGAPADYECARAWAICSHRIHAGIQVVSTLPALSLRPYGCVDDRFSEIAPHIDIVAAPARFDHDPTLARLHAMGKQTWLQPDRPPFSGSLAVGGSAMECRSVPWQAWLSGHSAIWIPRAGIAHVASEPTIAARPAPGGAPNESQMIALAYVGRAADSESLLPSIRLKRLALGAQEAAVLRTLELRGRGETARQIATALIHASGVAAYGDHYADGDFSRRVIDPAIWDQAARLAWGELVATIGNEAPAPDAAVSRTLLLDQARGVWAWVDGTSIVASDHESDRTWRVAMTIGVRNDTPRPVQIIARSQGQIDFEPHLRPFAIPPGDFRLLRLEGPCDRFEPDVHGHVQAPVRLRFDSAAEPGRGLSTRLNARLSVVMAPYSERAIHVDGDLSDWPPTAQNAAGHFQPVGRGRIQRLRPDGAPHRAGGEVAPSDSTTVWLCRDAERLLIAARCRANAAAPARGGSRLAPSAIEFDDLIPRAGDLLEVLIDPANRAGTPDELLYIMLRRNGDWYTGRGVPSSPPIGRVSEWQPAVEYAVRETTGGWVAEVSIPLRSFGVAVRPGTVWGLNLARFVPERGEYANWAAAPRYCYAPRTLGRLIWLPRPLP